METLGKELLNYLMSPYAIEREAANRIVSELLSSETACGAAGVALVDKMVNVFFLFFN
jgi:hypothetical protein